MRRDEYEEITVKASKLANSNKLGFKTLTASISLTLIFSLLPTNYSAHALDPAPIVNSLTPNHGPSSGGTKVTIKGANFNAGNISAILFLSGVNALNMSYVINSSSKITLTTPAQGTNGATNTLLIVSQAGIVTLTNVFTYREKPRHRSHEETD